MRFLDISYCSLLAIGLSGYAFGNPIPSAAKNNDLILGSSAVSQIYKAKYVTKKVGPDPEPDVYDRDRNRILTSIPCLVGNITTALPLHDL